jgi:hypothetical protein
MGTLPLIRLGAPMVHDMVVLFYMRLDGKMVLILDNISMLEQKLISLSRSLIVFEYHLGLMDDVYFAEYVSFSSLAEPDYFMAKMIGSTAMRKRNKYVVYPHLTFERLIVSTPSTSRVYCGLFSS